jgi:hypothetical protein
MDVPAQHLYSLQAAGTVRCYWLPLLGESLPRAMSPVRRDMVRVHTNHVALQERVGVRGSSACKSPTCPAFGQPVPQR